MSLSDEERQTLVRMELQKAREAYEDIGILQQAGRWSGAANRLYYAVFHAVNALFIHDGLQSNSHKGSHALFSMHYIKTGVLPSDFGRLYIQPISAKRSVLSFFSFPRFFILSFQRSAPVLSFFHFLIFSFQRSAFPSHTPPKAFFLCFPCFLCELLRAAKAL